MYFAASNKSAQWQSSVFHTSPKKLHIWMGFNPSWSIWIEFNTYGTWCV